jgi:uncharacterized membrane protein YgdD (TMEM256/DUF423 family)
VILRVLCVSVAAITPFGGTAFIAAWALFAWAVVKS